MNTNAQPETKGTILLVDDIPENLQLLSELLINLGYTVRRVTSGRMALKTVKVKPPDVILLDIKMPEMDGYQVCQALKADEELCDIPVIFISALDEAFDKIKAFQSGGVDYIAKPFQAEEVVVRLENQLTIQRQKRSLLDEIARRKEAEEILYQSRALLSSVLNTALDGIASMEAIRDPLTSQIQNFRCLVVNPVISKALGIKREELIGKIVVKQILNRINPELFDRFVNVVETGASLTDDLYYLLGESCWYHIVAVKLGDGVAITVRDITARKQSEITLQESETKFSTIFNNSPDPLWIATLNEGICLNVNDSLCQFLGFDRQEILGFTCIELRLWHDLADFYYYKKMLVETGMIQNFEVAVHTKSGETKDVLLSAKREKVNGQDCVIGVMKDISDRKQVEIALSQAKAAAEAATKAKSEFLSNMSHELRTPLNGILGYAQILKRSPTLHQSEIHGLNIIQQCGEHLLTLINDILDLSKIEAQKMELNLIDFHLPSLLLGVVEMCQIKAAQKDISFIYQFAHDLPQGVRADDKRLRQILINLLGNAIKFTNYGGVTFKVSTIDSPPFDNDQETMVKIRFEVEDTGIGINPDQIEKIFLPFEQVGESHQKSEGTGLGLAISQKIAETMGGKIEVKSQLSHGSVFSLELTLLSLTGWEQKFRPGFHRKIIGFLGSQKKILIVDDRWENRSVMINLLSSLGFAISAAENGAIGLAKAQEFQPDLIIVDLVMPVMDGFELTRRLREFPNFQDLVIICSSASIYQINQPNMIVPGANDFLAKPVKSHELFEKLAEHLKLEWLYEDHTDILPEKKEISPNIEKEIAIAIPTTELENLLDLAKRGRIKAILAQLDQIEKSHDQFIPFCDQIKQLATTFQIPKIQQLLEKHLSQLAHNENS